MLEPGQLHRDGTVTGPCAEAGGVVAAGAVLALIG
ncbi:hypothetical protein J2W14_000287 [Pseudarthrobacter oxydans]|nr:hypothetical protein [Pseudarthrobacter oxydans]